MTYATNTGGGGDPGSAVSVSNFPATQPVSGSVAATQSGTWNVGTLTGITNPVAVTGAFYQATQPVSGSVSVSNLPATQPISGSISFSTPQHVIADSGSVSVSNFPATQPVSGAVSVSNLPETQAVSGTVAAMQSGTWNVGTLTGITNPVAVTGAFYQATQPVSAAVLPLPSNAAQETSGNLDTLVAMGKLSAELITIHKQQLGMLRAIYLQLANISGIGSAPDDINDATLQ